MKKPHIIQLGLALMALVGSGSIASAQFATTNILYTFDTDIPVFSKWYGAVPTVMSWNPTNDAASNALSGSFQLDEGWPISDQYAINFNWNNTPGQGGGTNETRNMSLYAFEDLDILIDPSSTTNAAGNFGNLQLIANINFGQIVLGTFTIPVAATTNWVHVHAAIPPGLGNAWGPAFIKQGFGNGPLGPVTMYIDNLHFISVPAAPAILTQPADQEVFVGKNINMGVLAVGATPFAYQWFKGSTALVDGPTGTGSGVIGATNRFMTVTNVSATDTGYSVVVTNSASSVTSRVASVTLVSPATAGAYAQAVIAAGPVAFYELNETNAPSGGPAAFDHIGGFAGSYGTSVSNAFHGIAGPRFAGFTANNAAIHLNGNNNRRINLPPLNLNTNTVTLTAWIRPTAARNNAGIIFCRGGSTTSGLNYAGGSGNLGYHWNNQAITYNWQTSGCIPPLNEWSFVALVITPDDATMYCMNASQGIGFPGVNFALHGNQSFDVETRIGNDSNNNDRTFQGQIDAVAIYNRSLTADEVKALYYAGSGGPSLRLLGLDVFWDDVGTLLQAPSVTGPWTTNVGALSPFTISPTNPSTYFRLQIP